MFLMAALVMLAACGNATRKAEAADASAQTSAEDTIVYEHQYLVKVGDMAPDFTLQYTDGSMFTLSEQRGKVVMLQFTASWCGICRSEMPHIESEIWQRHKDNANFVLVGVDREETKDVVDAYTQKVGTTYPMALDTAANAFASYALRQSGITRNVLIDRDGKLFVIDFDRFDVGDPWEEFNRIVWDAEKCPDFASGMVDGYFGGEIPEEFWRLLALYLAVNALGSIPWAIPYGKREIGVMRRLSAQVLAWYNGMTETIPAWYRPHSESRSAT